MIPTMSYKCLFFYVLGELWKHWHNFLLFRFKKQTKPPKWIFKTLTDLLNWEAEMLGMQNLMEGKR